MAPERANRHLLGSTDVSTAASSSAWVGTWRHICECTPGRSPSPVVSASPCSSRRLTSSSTCVQFTGTWSLWVAELVGTGTRDTSIVVSVNWRSNPYLSWYDTYQDLIIIFYLVKTFMIDFRLLFLFVFNLPSWHLPTQTTVIKLTKQQVLISKAWYLKHYKNTGLLKLFKTCNTFSKYEYFVYSLLPKHLD